MEGEDQKDKKTGRKVKYLFVRTGATNLVKVRTVRRVERVTEEGPEL